MSIISCLAIILILGWALLPTFDYIDWMKMRKTSTVRIPITGEKIRLSYIFSIYGIFMISGLKEIISFADSVSHTEHEYSILFFLHTSFNFL